jgi:WhiB family transcriptional regulator, redox-sensing transcriptional regulator
MPQQPLAQLPEDVEWHWQEHGSCQTADPTLFFHPQNERGAARRSRVQAAKRVCASCPVRTECADYAIRAREPYGIWGGMSEEEREEIYAVIDAAVGGAKAYPRHRGAGAEWAETILSSRNDREDTARYAVTA